MASQAHILGQPTHMWLLTTKSAALEDATAVEVRSRKATHDVPLERLALRPQGGFALTEAGKPLILEEQEAAVACGPDRLAGVTDVTPTPNTA